MDKSDILSVVFLMCAMFVVGFGIGKEEVSTDNKEIIELNIELTKLNIKKLKGECNESN